EGNLGFLDDARGGDVFVEPGGEIVADGNLSVLAVFFPEAQHAVVAQVAVVGQAEPGHGADAGAGIGQDAEHGAIPETNDITDIRSTGRVCEPARWRARRSCPRSRCIWCRAPRRTG